MARTTYNTSSSADNFVIGYFIFWLIWALLKIPFLIILIVNIINLISAIQNNMISTFDFTWLVISLAGVIVL